MFYFPFTHKNQKEIYTLKTICYDIVFVIKRCLNVLKKNLIKKEPFNFLILRFKAEYILPTIQ